MLMAFGGTIMRHPFRVVVCAASRRRLQSQSHDDHHDFTCHDHRGSDNYAANNGYVHASSSHDVRGGSMAIRAHVVCKSL